MLLGCIADDFTGGSDLGNTLSKAGMRSTLFSGLPTGPHSADLLEECDAGIVALKTRSIPLDEAVAQSLEALDWLRTQGAQQILFKYCSTFDSTAAGNIGPVAEALMKALGTDRTIFCPAFPETGRSVYMGHLFVGDRLLNESGMQHHPLTPMTDPDLRRWLRPQVSQEVGLLRHADIAAGKTEAALAHECDEGRRLIVCDTLGAQDLRAIGRAVADWPLVTGGSGIGMGLAQNFKMPKQIPTEIAISPRETGPAVVLSGSCSRMSNRQLAYALNHMPGFAIDPDALMAGRLTIKDITEFALAVGDGPKVIYSTADPDATKGSQQAHGREEVASRLERFFGDIACALVAQGHRRIIVGGGETSSAVVQALRIRELHIGREIDPGVPALTTSDGLRITLKSGNFGGEDFYWRAVTCLEDA